MSPDSTVGKMILCCELTTIESEATGMILWCEHGSVGSRLRLTINTLVQEAIIEDITVEHANS